MAFQFRQWAGLTVLLEPSETDAGSIRASGIPVRFVNQEVRPMFETNAGGNATWTPDTEPQLAVPLHIFLLCEKYAPKPFSLYIRFTLGSA